MTLYIIQRQLIWTQHEDSSAFTCSVYFQSICEWFQRVKLRHKSDSPSQISYYGLISQQLLHLCIIYFLFDKYVIMLEFLILSNNKYRMYINVTHRMILRLQPRLFTKLNNAEAVSVQKKTFSFTKLLWLVVNFISFVDINMHPLVFVCICIFIQLCLGILYE